MEDRLKSAAEEANKKKALKEVVEVTVREKSTVVENAKKRVRVAERAQALVEQNLAEVIAKLKEVKLRLAGAESLNSTKDKEIVELKAIVEVSEDEWYNTGFTDAENLAKPVMFQSQ